MARTPRRPVPLGLCSLLLLALLASASSAQAWVCYPDPAGLCQEVQDATGLVVDIATSPDGIGVIIDYGAAGYEDRLAVAVCVHNFNVWVSSTGYCSTPPTTPKDRVSYLAP